MMAFPKLVRNPKTPAQVVIAASEPNEFGERETLLDAKLQCNYQDSTRARCTTEKQSLEATGSLYFDGDILPGADIACGHVTVFGHRREIIGATKARNLDGTVNYTRLDVR